MCCVHISNRNVCSPMPIYNAGVPLAGKSAGILVAGIPADLLGGRNCWCQTEQSPLAVTPAGNCKIPAGVSRAATNHVAAAEFSHASNFKGHAV